jgi:hypothetical protein
LCGTTPVPRAEIFSRGDQSSNILGTEVQDKSSNGLPVNQEHNAKEEKKETAK